MALVLTLLALVFLMVWRITQLETDLKRLSRYTGFTVEDIKRLQDKVNNEEKSS